MEDIADPVMMLNRAGWSLVDAAFVAASGKRVRVVFARKRENLVRAKAATQDGTGSELFCWLTRCE